jgi:hypothetical protein
LLTPDSGAAVIAGNDVLRGESDLRAYLVRLAGQSVTMDKYLSGLANLTMIGRYTASAAGTPDCEAKS